MSGVEGSFEERVREALDRHRYREIDCDCHTHGSETPRCPWHSVEVIAAEADATIAKLEAQRLGMPWAYTDQMHKLWGAR